MEQVLYRRVFHCVNPNLLCLCEDLCAINAESYINCVSLFIIATHDLSLCDSRHYHLHVPVLQLLQPLVCCVWNILRYASLSGSDVDVYIIIRKLLVSVFIIQLEQKSPYRRSSWTYRDFSFRNVAYSRCDVTSEMFRTELMSCTFLQGYNCGIWYCHGLNRENCLLACDTVYSGRSLPIFRRNLLLPSSG